MNNRSMLGLAAMGLLFSLGGCSKTAKSSPDSLSSSPIASNNPSTSDTSAALNSPGAPSGPSAPDNPAQSAPPSTPVVINAGTKLTVTVDQTVSTKTSNSGDRFAASLAEPVTISRDLILPRGSHVSGTVIQSDAAGRVKGGATLALTLDSITVHGKTYSIETDSFEEVGKGRGKRTAVGAGGGAAFGAIVGALAGGGKGAAIGAVAGGGAGTAGTALTGNRDITIPAETRLHFKLRKSLRIQQR